MNLPGAVRIREVGPRDGIQSEPPGVPTEDKIRLIDTLGNTGLRYIEAVSFVSPRAVPQMADARDVWRGIRRDPEVFYSALVPNRKGADIAIEEGLDGLQVFMAATDPYNLKNVKKTVKESLDDVGAVVAAGEGAGIPVEGTLSTVFGDPYEGDIAIAEVVGTARSMRDLGVRAISFGDTTGMGTPTRVQELVSAVRDAMPELMVNMHFHDTRGTGLPNVLAALDCGVDYFDSSIGGMGGSPFASGATGNVATEDLVHMLSDMGIDTGIDLDALLRAAEIAQDIVEGELPSKVLKAGPRSSRVGTSADGRSRSGPR